LMVLAVLWHGDAQPPAWLPMAFSGHSQTNSLYPPTSWLTGRLTYESHFMAKILSNFSSIRAR
jgi:hypothetical protein